jgi:hypothetical protein
MPINKMSTASELAKSALQCAYILPPIYDIDVVETRIFETEPNRDLKILDTETFENVSRGISRLEFRGLHHWNWIDWCLKVNFQLRCACAAIFIAAQSQLEALS